MKTYWRIFACTAATAALGVGLVACGDDDDGGDFPGPSGGSADSTLESGDFRFEVEFEGAAPVEGEVRRAGSVEAAASGMEWWGFNLTFKNVSAKEMVSANAPDVGVACGDELDADATFVESPGFVMGQPAFKSGMIDNGASNSSLVPLQVAIDASDCRFLVRMDPLHDPNPPEIVSFPFAR